jgi:hypothetical protein
MFYASKEKKEDFYLSKELEDLIDLEEEEEKSNNESLLLEFINKEFKTNSFKIIKLSKTKNKIYIYFHSNNNFITDLILDNIEGIKLSLFDEKSIDFNNSGYTYEFESINGSWIVKFMIDTKEILNGI